MKEQEVPKVGEYYHFWDDGKTSPSRHYICRVEEVIRVKDAKKIEVSVPEWDDLKNQNVFHTETLYNKWEEQVVGHDWLYAKETDYFIRISCPEYDKYDLYAVRTKSGGWFTIDVQSWWQGGRLDVDGSIYDEMIEYCYEGDFNFEDYPPADEEHYNKRFS